MQFLTSAEKVKKLRKQLNLNQEDLIAENITRGLISMIETGRRDISYKTAIKLAENFSKKAEDLNIILNIDEGYLMRSPGEDAEIYCLNKLKNHDITQNTIDEIFELVEQYDLLFVQAKTYFKIGEISDENKNFDEACTNYDKSIVIYKTIGKSEDIGQVYLRMGICKGKNLQHDTAIVYFNLSQYYGFVYDDKKIQQSSLYNLANAYRHVNKINLALETVQKYLAACDESDPFYNFASNIEANCYTDKGEYEKAIGIYNVLLSKLQENDILVGYTYNNLGLIYCHINDYKESIKYFEMAEKIISEIDKSLLSHTLIEKSTVLLNENLYTDAIETIELGLTYAKEYNDIEYLIKGNYILAGIYDKLNYTENLENVYLEMIDLLRTTCNKNDLKSIYDTLALIYLKKNKLALCEKYLVLSKYLN